MINFGDAHTALTEMVELLVNTDWTDEPQKATEEVARLYKKVEHALKVGELAHATLDRLVSTMFDPAVTEFRKRLGE